MEFVLKDSTIVKAHQHATGAKKNNDATDEVLARSQGKPFMKQYFVYILANQRNGTL